MLIFFGIVSLINMWHPSYCFKWFFTLRFIFPNTNIITSTFFRLVFGIFWLFIFKCVSYYNSIPKIFKCFIWVVKVVGNSSWLFLQILFLLCPFLYLCFLYLLLGGFWNSASILRFSCSFSICAASQIFLSSMSNMVTCSSKVSILLFEPFT